MDWSSVTAEDLVDALREVDWSTPPRPVSEFFSRFTAPPVLLQVDQPPQMQPLLLSDKLPHLGNIHPWNGLS
ncbi:unnamed protein product [Urochloa humidicola]